MFFGLFFFFFCWIISRLISCIWPSPCKDLFFIYRRIGLHRGPRHFKIQLHIPVKLKLNLRQIVVALRTHYSPPLCSWNDVLTWYELLLVLMLTCKILIISNRSDLKLVESQNSHQRRHSKKFFRIRKEIQMIFSNTCILMFYVVTFCF